MLSFCVPASNCIIGADDAIPMEYGKPIAILFPRSGTVYVIQGMADPLQFSSQAYFIVHKINNLDRLSNLLQDQDQSGPKPPMWVKEVEKRVVLVLHTGERGSTILKPDGELKMNWQPGNEKMCWLMIPKDEETRIRSLFEKPPFGFEFTRDDFLAVGTYIATESEKKMKDSIRTMEHRKK